MHRSNFRAKQKFSLKSEPKAQPASSPRELEAIREQIENVSRSIKSDVDRLATPTDDISVPKDIERALKLTHARLDRLESQHGALFSELKRLSDLSERVFELRKASESFAKALQLAHDRLDGLESMLRDMRTSFANAALEMAGQIEKMVGGEAAMNTAFKSFEDALRNRKFTIKRDQNGNMTGFKTE